MTYQAFTVMRRSDGAKVGSVEAQSAEQAVYRLAGGEFGRSDYVALGGTDRPLAGEGLTSYRYRDSRYTCVMIGAMDTAGALREASRSITGAPDPAKLDVFSAERCAYVPAL